MRFNSFKEAVIQLQFWTLLGFAITVPFSKGRLMLGTWQQIIFIDFDNRSRSREVTVQITGKKK